MSDVATLVFDIDSSGAVGAAKALAGLDRAAASTATMAARLERVSLNTAKGFRTYEQALEDSRGEIQRLAASYNPVLAAQMRFADAQKQVARAVHLGVISADQQADVLRRLQAQYSQTSVAAGNMQASVGNQFAQLNDVVVTAWGGMNPALIGMQQGMQMVQGFAGQSLPQALGTLRGAFAQLLNPVTLVTIGAVAAGAAVIQMGTSLFSASADAESAADAMSEAASANDKYISSLRASRAPLDELVEKYGRLALVAREALQNMAEVDRIDAYRKSMDALALSIDSVTAFTWTGVNAGLDDAIAGVGRYNAAYGNMAVALERVRNAQTEVDRLAASRALSDEMLAAYGSVEKMPQEMFQLYTNLQKTIENTAAAKGATDSWAGSMSGVLSYLNSIAGVLSGIGGGAVQLAALQTETKLLKQGKSLREASLAASRESAILEGKNRTAELEAQYGIVGRGMAALETGQKLAIINAKEELSVQQEIAREREKESKSGGGGGGRGAAELKAAQKGFQSLRELLEQESIYQVAEYEKRQLQLEAALNKNLLTKQQYQLMESQLQTYYFGTEHEKRKLQYEMELQQLKDFLEQKKITQQQYNMASSQLHWGQVQALGQADANQYSLQLDHMSQNFAAMNQIAGGGYDSLLKAQKIFGAASALISTYTGAAEALKLPFPYNMMAAGKIIAAGMGFANAIKGGGTGKATAATATSATAQTQDPLKTYTINITDDGWMGDMQEAFLRSIQGALADGVNLQVRRS